VLSDFFLPLKPLKMKNIFLKLFYADAFLELAIPLFFPDFAEARLVTKPLLLILLMGHIAVENPRLPLFFTAVFALLA
jgi:hypothetical protein